MRRSLVTFCFLLLCGIAGLAVPTNDPQVPFQPRAFVLKNMRVHLDADQVLENAHVVIRDGLVQSVGKDVPIPADAQVIEFKGGVVYPGFIDAGSDWGVDSQKRPQEPSTLDDVDLANETLARTPMENRKGLTPEFLATEALKIDADALQQWQRQGLVARVVLPGDAILAGQCSLLLLNDTSVRKALQRHGVALYGNFHRWSPPGFPSTLMGNLAHLRQFFLDVGYHSRLRAAYEANPAGREPTPDEALEAASAVLQGHLPVIFAADTADEIHRVCDFAAEFQIKPIIWGGAEAWKTVDRLQKEQVAVILRLNFDEYAPPRRRFAIDGGADNERDEDKPKVPARVEAEQKERKEQRWKTAGVLAVHNIRFAFSSQGLKKPEEFLPAVRHAVEAGLAPADALKALTTQAASILRADKQLGKIAAGRPAHLIVMSEPFEQKSSEVKYAFVDGKRMDYAFPRLDSSPGPERGERGAGPRQRPGRPGQTTPNRGQEGSRGERRTAPTERKADDTAAKENPNKVSEQTTPKVSSKPEVASEIEADRIPPRRTGGDCLIKGATLITIAKGNVQADLLIEKGKIAKIGENLSAPPGVTVIDAKGLYVMPGIIDTHCHFSITGGVNDSTLSAVPEIRVRDVIHSEDVNIYRALAGGMTTARLLHGSANCIGGQDAVIKLKYGTSAKEMLVADAPRGIKFALGENVKRSGGRFPNTRLGVEAVLVRAFTEADQYRRQWKQFRTQNAAQPMPEPRRDLRLEALADILDGNLHIHCHCYRADEILMLLRVADRFGFKIKSLQHCLEGYKVAPEIAAHGASISSFSDWWAYKIEAYDAIPFNAALVQEAGGLVCLKSDSNELMRHLYQEAAKLQKYGGFSAEDALKTITLNAAKQLGLDHRLGTLEVGKDADVAFFNGHPLDGYARCVRTLVEGEVYFEEKEIAPLQAFTPPPARGPELGFLSIEKGAAYALRQVNVHTVSGPMIPDTTVLIEYGRIKRVHGPGENPPPPTGYIVVEGKGLHLYPGMIDSATILGLTELGSAQETQDYAEGGDFQPDLRAVTGVNPDSELIPVTRVNGVLSVVTRPSGAMVAGQSALINLNGWTAQEMAIVDALTLNIDFPTLRSIFSMSPNGPRLGQSIVRKQRDLKIRRMKELFEQARRYAELRRQQSEDAPKRKIDPRLEALLPYVRKEKPVVIQANREEDILAALELAEALQVKAILSGALDAWKVPEAIKKSNVSVLLGPIMHSLTNEFDPFDGLYRCAAVLHRHGIPFAIRSEGGPNSRNLPYEAAMAASYGLPRDVALKAVTLYPAQILGVGAQLGSIEEGKSANVVLADGDILQPTTQVKALFIAGSAVDPANKQSRLYEKYRQRVLETKGKNAHATDAAKQAEKSGGDAGKPRR